jgi:hypothetical protein
MLAKQKNLASIGLEPGRVGSNRNGLTTTPLLNIGYTSRAILNKLYEIPHQQQKLDSNLSGRAKIFPSSKIFAKMTALFMHPVPPLAQSSSLPPISPTLAAATGTTTVGELVPLP